ncbi:MAG TPA: chemotaxis protein CheX [Bryobacteraceae bacterium]|nr:chemotaxis protein CheX [Bryobacteraceae bacterium]
MTQPNPAELISRADLVEAIVAATNEVFSTMLNLRLTAEEVQTEPNVAAAPSSGVVSLIGMAGAWVGTGSLACTVSLACRLSSQFLATTCDSMSEEVLDTIGEITNMIVGNVKTAIEEKAGPMGLSTPTVIYGRNFQTRSARIHEWTVVPFTCEEERFYIQLSIGPNQDAAQGAVRPGFQVPQLLNI